MIKIEHIETMNWTAAVRGMRNAMNSWDKSDSYWTYIENPRTENTAKFEFFVGENDLALMQKLYAGGTSHRKFMRQIIVSMDITAPLYWWKEFDTYKIGTTANSCSTMHKIHAKEFTMDDFSHDHLSDYGKMVMERFIGVLNAFREMYNENKSKTDWWGMVALLPSNYNQKRTITMNYENAAAMIDQRKGHKLDEWREFVDVLMDLPYMREIAAERK